MTLKEIIYSDYKAYNSKNGIIKEGIFNSGFKLSKAFRKCNYYRNKNKLLYLLFRVQYHNLCIKYGFDVPSHVSIGTGVKVFHPNGIVINSLTKIGDNFTIAGGSKIGIKESGKAAVIGNNVTVGINCTIIGDVHIGDNVLIGAGAVVVKDIPPNSIVAGNPARVIGNTREG